MGAVFDLPPRDSADNGCELLSGEGEVVERDGQRAHRVRQCEAIVQLLLASGGGGRGGGGGGGGERLAIEPREGGAVRQQVGIRGKLVNTWLLAAFTMLRCGRCGRCLRWAASEQARQAREVLQRNSALREEVSAVC